MGTDRREKCGLAAEIMSIALIISSIMLSVLISLYVIKLYVVRAKGQDANVNKLRMSAGDDEKKDTKKTSKNDRNRPKDNTDLELNNNYTTHNWKSDGNTSGWD